jgi:UDP-glucose 4-epimerase
MILITGGAGYIGSHTNKLLNKKGYKTVVFDNLERGHFDFVKWGEFFKGDLRNIEDVRNVFDKYNIRAVIHFAAYAYVGESVVEPEKYYRNNVFGTLNLLSVMKDYGVKNIIFSSSCATYGIPSEIPIKENTYQNPINPYGKTKLFCEQMIKDFTKSYDFKYVILRYFNAAGADPDCEIGELHDPETHLIPLVIKGALDSNYYLNVYGDNYDTKDGTCIRDYIHVMDLADGHLKGLEYLINSGVSDEFNLGIGKGYSVIDIINVTEEIIGTKVKFNISERRDGDPPILVASNEKIKRVLGWKPYFEEIKPIIETAYNWYLNKCT